VSSICGVLTLVAFGEAINVIVFPPELYRVDDFMLHEWPLGLRNLRPG
jgi:hypothetical protein